MEFRVNPLDVVIYGLIALLAIGVLGLIGILVYYAFDSSSLPLEQGQGRIVGKEYTPAYNTTGLIPMGKGLMPITTYHPDRWEVAVAVGDQQNSISVTEEFYESAAEGDWVRVEFVRGRYSGNLYLRNIWPFD